MVHSEDKALSYTLPKFGKNAPHTSGTFRRNSGNIIDRPRTTKIPFPDSEIRLKLITARSPEEPAQTTLCMNFFRSVVVHGQLAARRESLPKWWKS